MITHMYQKGIFNEELASIHFLCYFIVGNHAEEGDKESTSEGMGNDMLTEELHNSYLQSKWHKE